MEDGDLRAAFKTLKLLRPWQPARRAQLKNPEGYLLSPAEEPEGFEAVCGGHLRFTTSTSTAQDGTSAPTACG